VLPRLSEKYINRMGSINNYQEDASAMGRIATNHAAINMIKKYPFFGVGAGNFNEIFLDFTPEEELQWVEPGKSIHNVVLQATSETGIIGVTVYLMLVLMGFKNTFARKNKAENNSFLDDAALILRVALLTIFVAQQFGQGAYYGNLYLILPLASALKMINNSFSSNAGLQRQSRVIKEVNYA